MTPAQKLLTWYKKEGRDLPWRHTRDAYAILISEVMLQQTQVQRVMGFYERWLKQFPAWKELANAKTDEVIRAWSGLGYNRRGLMLRSIAQHIVLHGEPKTEAAWRELKGIGPYTAAALAAFSLKHRTLPIDTNIRRVLGRVLLGIPFPQLTNDEPIREATQQFLPTHGNYFDIPQAIFDLATSVCAKSPQCALCPLRADCKSSHLFLTGQVEIPKRTIKQAKEKIHPGKRYPDRIYRGRILKLLKQANSKLSLPHIALQIDPDYQKEPDEPWIEAMLTRLTHEGFLEKHEACWSIAR